MHHFIANQISSPAPLASSRRHGFCHAKVTQRQERKRAASLQPLDLLARPAGIEPTTPWFVARVKVSKQLISLVANARRASFRLYCSTSFSRKVAQKSRTQMRESRSDLNLVQRRRRSFSRCCRMLFSIGNSQRSSVAADAPGRRRAFAEMRSQKRIDPFLAFHNEARLSFWTLRDG